MYKQCDFNQTTDNFKITTKLKVKKHDKSEKHTLEIRSHSKPVSS